jgi:pimeloyl-ACP methyl ester carboxylesterase
MKNTKLFYLNIFIGYLILSLVLTSKVVATDLFFEDFSDNNLNQWTEVVGNIGSTTSWISIQGKLHSYVGRKGFAYLCAKTDVTLSDYIFEAEVKNISGVDQQFIFRASSDKKNYYLVTYRYDDSSWPQDNNNIKLYKIYSNGFRLLGTYPSLLVPRSVNITQNVNHKIKVVLNQRNIKIYFDELVLIDENDEDENIYMDGEFCLMTWGGDYLGVSENVFDNIKIQDTARNKVVILPGLGASWNAEAILSGSTAPSFQWTMTPFVNNYNLLISGLENNDLVKNQDYFVWNYDWRKPLAQIVNDFNNYVLSLNLTAGEKIDLVGHSLGGLVARVWTQDNPLLVEEIISLGSPHYGSLKAYEAWNGAKISDSVDIASIALNVLMQLQKKNFDTTVETLRQYAPIVFDLSPTFTFLKRNGLEVSTNSSQYLVSKNNLVSSIGDKLLTIDGVGEITKEWINLGERSLFDKVLGIWEEGRPLSYVNGIGDGTVLKKSALISEADKQEFPSNHGEIVDKSVNLILNRLDLGVTVNEDLSYPGKQSIFYLGSPATMSVNCEGSVTQDIEGWIMIADKDLDACQLSLTGKDGGGPYHLVSGDKDSWQYFEGEIDDQEILNLSNEGVENQWAMLRRAVIEVGATNMIAPIDQRNITLSIDEYINYRKNKKVFKNSEDILNNLRIILNTGIFSNTEIKAMFLKAKASQSLVQTNLRLLARLRKIPTYSASINNEQANILMKEGRNYAANYLANKLYEIVWK